MLTTGGGNSSFILAHFLHLSPPQQKTYFRSLSNNAVLGYIVLDRMAVVSWRFYNETYEERKNVKLQTNLLRKIGFVL